MKIDICVTAYNEDKNLETLFNSFVNLKKNNHYVENLILVDNGSTDSTQNLLKEIKHPNIKCYRTEQNLKYGGGMALSIEKSESNYVCLVPADNQYNFNHVSNGINNFFKEEDFSTLLFKGARIHREDPIQIRILSKIYTNTISLALKSKIKDVNGQPKIFSKQNIYKQVKLLPHDASFDASLLQLAIKNKYKIKEFDIPYQNRKYGKSSWENKKFEIGAKMFLNFIKFKVVLKFKDGS